MLDTISACSEQLASKAVSSVELTTQFFDRIERHNPALGAYLWTERAASLAQARAADERRRRGDAVTPLTGVPLAIKDVMHAPGYPTTCASKILKNFRPTFVATAVQRLIDAGAVVLGKTNMDEFAMGASNEHSAYYPARNPWDPTRTPGGSSGGSAVAVAASLCAGALGSDTGGSVRQPAGLCGIVGMKPTYGRVSRYGLVAFASSLDQIGPMTWTVRDSALLLQTIAGHDPADSTSLSDPVPDYLQALQGDIRGLRVGIPEEYFTAGMNDEVDGAVRTAIKTLQSLGAQIVPIHLPHTKYAVPCYYILAPAEASANLARYDGVRFGHRSTHQGTLHEMYQCSRSEGFGPEVLRRIMLGTFVLSSGYYDAYYQQAQKVRTLIARDFETAYTQVDVVCTPTTPYTAFRIGEKVEDPVTMYLADICTVSCNLAGLPGISIPCGFSRDRLPIGLQFIGRHLDETTVLRTAHAYEQATGWHKERPTV